MYGEGEDRMREGGDVMGESFKVFCSGASELWTQHVPEAQAPLLLVPELHFPICPSVPSI